MDYGNKLIIVNDSDVEAFSQSTCTCDFCEDTHKAVRDWETFVPKTTLQHKMMEVVDRIQSNLVISKKKIKK